MKSSFQKASVEAGRELSWSKGLPCRFWKKHRILDRADWNGHASPELFTWRLHDLNIQNEREKFFQRFIVKARRSTFWRKVLSVRSWPTYCIPNFRDGENVPQAHQRFENHTTWWSRHTLPETLHGAVKYVCLILVWAKLLCGQTRNDCRDGQLFIMVFVPLHCRDRQLSNLILLQLHFHDCLFSNLVFVPFCFPYRQLSILVSVPLRRRNSGLSNSVFLPFDCCDH